MKKLNIIATIKDGIAIGMINFLSLVLTAVLYVVTIWIPYLNVGTTIAMASLPAELAKGNVVNPLFIFDGKYRKNMGEFFILMALMGGAIGVGFFFGRCASQTNSPTAKNGASSALSSSLFWLWRSLWLSSALSSASVMYRS